MYVIKTRVLIKLVVHINSPFTDSRVQHRYGYDKQNCL